MNPPSPRLFPRASALALMAALLLSCAMFRGGYDGRTYSAPGTDSAFYQRFHQLAAEVLRGREMFVNAVDLGASRGMSDLTNDFLRRWRAQPVSAEIERPEVASQASQVRALVRADTAGAGRVRQGLQGRCAEMAREDAEVVASSSYNDGFKAGQRAQTIQCEREVELLEFLLREVGGG